MTKAEIEAALDAGHLWALMYSGRWWRLRRNGATQTWKRQPDRYSIPVKAGLRSTARIDNDWPADNLRVSETDPNPTRRKA